MEYTVNQSFLALYYEDGRFVRLLKPGKHTFSDSFFSPKIDRRFVKVDMRERSIVLKGQEILTSDKVAIRVSLLVYYKVNDPVAAVHEVENYEERIYEDVQLAARRYLASRSLDDILKDRNEISDAVRENVGESATRYGVEILRADVKDLVFPGNLREIMNQVLETERRAEARLIQVRKEAEANRLKTESEYEGRLRDLETEKETIRIRGEAEREKFRLSLQSEIDLAVALAQHPALMKIKQLEALRALAVDGAKIVLDMRSAGLSEPLDEN